VFSRGVHLVATVDRQRHGVGHAKPCEIGQLAVAIDADEARVADGKKYRDDWRTTVPAVRSRARFGVVSSVTTIRPMAVADYGDDDFVWHTRPIKSGSNHKPKRFEIIRAPANLCLVSDFEQKARLDREAAERAKHRLPTHGAVTGNPVAVRIAIVVLDMHVRQASPAASI